MNRAGASQLLEVIKLGTRVSSDFGALFAIAFQYECSAGCFVQGLASFDGNMYICKCVKGYCRAYRVRSVSMVSI